MNITAEIPGVEAEIAALDDRSLTELRKRWSRLFKSSTPKGFSRDLIVRGLAYKIQEKAHGGLSQSARRKLRTLAKQLEADDRSGFDPGPTLKPGAKLIREWQERTYTITVLQDGFEYEGQRYQSLSKVAREITGVRWSGPRFFGLRQGKANAEG